MKHLFTRSVSVSEHSPSPGPLPLPVAIVTFVAASLFCSSASAQQEFPGWNLEPGVGRAHLVMIARVASISRVKIVEGAKTDVALRQYRFQPVRRLKGIFQRDQLSMTASDLGLPAENGSSKTPLKEGEFRLLILAQRRGLTSFGCVSAAPGVQTFEERVPLLSGADDPLVAVVETLIKVADSRSRKERATLVVDQLGDADGLPAVPLLTSLRLRADWAAADERAFAPLARLARNQHRSVRAAALEVLAAMLKSGTPPPDVDSLGEVAGALREILESEEPVTRVRLIALKSLGHLLAMDDGMDWARPLLIAQLTTAETYAERAAAAQALAQLKHPEAVAAVLKRLETLPIDEAPETESVYVRAAVKLDAARAELVLLTRLKRSLAARQSLATEIEQLGRLKSKSSLPLLLDIADWPYVSRVDRLQAAWALGRVGDDRAVPILAAWLGGSDAKLKQRALTALEGLDSRVAARDVRPLLKSETHLPYKLRIARLLARQGLADGYSLATEHLADEGYTASAALVLAAIDDPRTQHELTAIVTARPDRRWRAAALTGLAAIHDPAARGTLLGILNDDRHPLVAEAAEAAGLATDGRLLHPLARLARSRNQRIAMASLVALRRCLSGVRSSPLGLAAVDPAIADGGESRPQTDDIPTETRNEISAAVAAIAVDPYVEAKLRQQALAVARLLGGPGYAETLSEMADQAELEGTRLLAEVQKQRRRDRGLDEPR